MLPQAHGNTGHLWHVQPGREQLLRPGEHLRRSPAHQHVSGLQHQDSVYIPGDLVHAVAHQDDGALFIAVVVPDVVLPFVRN